MLGDLSMVIDRLTLFLGKPVEFNGVLFYSPTIDEISEIGEIMYHVHLNFAMFDKENIFKQLYQVSDEEYKQIEQLDDYDVLTLNDMIAGYIASAYSFFTKEEVKFDNISKIFISNKHILIQKENYKQIINVIKKINGINQEKEKLQFKNDRVKKKYEQHMNRKKAMMKKKEFELKDMLSVLCNAEGNGINIFNVGKLTVYQVYEHFERVNIMENHKRMLALWANTFSLKEGTKLEDWIVRTNF